MDIKRSSVVNASILKSSSRREITQIVSLEVVLSILFMLLCVSSLYFGKQYFPKFELSQNFLPFSNASSAAQTIDPSKSFVLAKSESIEIESFIGKEMFYFYGYARNSFSNDKLTVFKLHSKALMEERILSTLPKRMQARAKNYIRAVLMISQRHQVDPLWVLSVMWTESHFKYKAKSIVGARGLMQIMPETKKYIYKLYKRRGNSLVVEADKFNINEYFPYKVLPYEVKNYVHKLVNIELGVIYLKGLLKDFKQSHKLATVAYNMGPGWTRGRLRRNLPVGQKNLYLTKVKKAYSQIAKKI